MSDRPRRRWPVLVVMIVLVAILIPVLFATEDEKGAERPAIVAIGEKVHVTEPVDGDVQSFGGPVQIDSEVHGDVLSIGGDVAIGPEGKVDGEIVVLAGEVTSANEKTIKGKVVRPLWIGDAIQKIPNGSDFLDTLDRRFSYLVFALKVSVLLVWLAVAIIIALAGSKEVRASSVELRATPLHTMTVGLVGFTSFVLTAIVFSYLIPYFIGLPLLMALCLFAAVAKIYGMVVVFHAVGHFLFAPKTRAAMDSRRFFKGDLAMVVLGVLVLGMIRMVPVLGGVLWMTGSLLAVGAALSTKFGRREPWFLAVESTT